MSTRKAVSIGIVVLLHIAIGYAFITGLAFNVIKKVAEKTTVIDVKEAPPPPEKPPPPPPPEQKTAPPPPQIVAPPPIVRTQAPAPVLAPPAPPVPPPPAPPRIVAPPAPPAITVVSKAASAKGNPGSWITDADYPPGAQRDQKEGVSVIAFTINAEGRIENCHTSQSSGTPELDETACRLVTRRGRYSPAKDQAGNPITQAGNLRFRWTLPKD